MNCHYCNGHIPWSDKGHEDDEGSHYHYQCGQRLFNDGTEEEEEGQEVSIRLSEGPPIIRKL